MKTQISEIQRPDDTPIGKSKRWFRLSRSIYRARFICVTDDSCKSNDCHSKTVTLRRTSSRRSISLHPSQNGKCIVNNENSKVSMSGYVDSSLKTQWSKSRSSMKGPVVPLERNLYGRPLAGLLWESQFKKILLKYEWKKIAKLGLHMYKLRKGLLFSCMWTS